ncbi:protein C-terminal leucine carboxyl O-methyltransferase ppm1 [Aspergillus nidulans FGSC A4]|uniref:Leucine carboxyl methyltransferase 1 n=1 Tax=Emericella nidulans (strain FGSC A4 / ATCC 38163 / CBS 112.46 / NRRL 194 / M139) TaxID=227321 RepID=LCMT1_EMENI|nr:leucine carboxy methyltransferase ppm1 [Aspergillus nidulans FGSC A4]Q5AQJ2.2 RecName: Full=Leucine carboxyl methyltransferase 1; AltName: Full=Protein phosphatase methyltransferase 1; AltName: Full=[Phosphatase 2A protein]-leucine-carboxy methyltransferase 1 [Aspergillus nidulans FGSC A4]CBF88905.1 TPA: Leucine carboxyl methyltransferase 1 (EC 2.1.1.-)(Protein phosphatase methyltransferase 1) [Source:UniProtKB/Swiss-Prot;Acc:Q5AQJ2] [Aspergillus nidulans FGSC A4]
MSAPQIPNLNTLRRGGGRGRFRARGGPDSSSSSGNKDRVVQGTDNDASVSRLSAVELGYLEDPFARALTPMGQEMRRLPIINRGTYVRTTAIDQLVASFLGLKADSDPTWKLKKKQIISLGAGSDTRVFRLLSLRPALDIIYHEIDFAVNNTAKIKAIQGTPLLQRVLGQSQVSISNEGDELHSPAYHIHAVDLRTLAQKGEGDKSTGQDPGRRLQDFVDTTLPTLLLSECCLIYLSPNDAAGVVRYFTHTLFPASQETETLALVLYEPIRPDDAFGRTMVANLATRGIQLQTLHQYASLGAQRQRLREHGFNGGQAAADVDFLWERWVAEEEKERVAALEMLDEVEEWKLLAQHYCVAWGWRKGSTRFTGWGDLDGQSAEE